MSPAERNAAVLLIRRRGRRDYAETWAAMRRFTDARGPDTTDELWLLEHPPVFTLGQAARPEHLLAPGDIPVIATDRGGQVTYHGPGQAIAYLLYDLRRGGIGVKDLVARLEGAVIDLLAAVGVAAATRPGAPGVYCNGAKLAALGLRVRRGRCYHGLALNLDLDLAPFARINPCGYPGLAVARLADLAPASFAPVRADWEGRLASAIARRLALIPVAAADETGQL